MAETVFSSEGEYDGYLKVNSCGKQWLANRDCDTLRKNGRIDFSINYISKGVGYCVIDSEVVSVPEGSLVVYFPRVEQHYSFKKESPSIMLWSHFSGSACELLKKSISSSVKIIKIRERKQFEDAFEKMIVAHYKKKEKTDVICEGYMLVLMSLIVQSNIQDTETISKANNENLEKVLSDMHINFNKTIDIKKYAKICCVSEEHFIRLFKAYTGFPPYNYQLRIRINRAIELLEKNCITVGECAKIVGFNDIYYFSKIFKKFTGYSPSYYKKQK